MGNLKLSYSKVHPIILHGNHPITKLVIQSEHLRLLYAGPIQMISLNQRFHVTGLRRTVRSITRQCVICKRQSLKPHDQLLGQLSLEWVTPASVFEKVGVDYTGPFHFKYGHIRKPTVVKAYVCLFVCLSVKAVHLELVSDLTTDAFVAALRRFVARRSYPSLIWSDHSTNFVGANRELKELLDFLHTQQVQETISEFCNCKIIEWRFIPERAPHFFRLWESAVKSTKLHLSRVVGNVKLTFEEPFSLKSKHAWTAAPRLLLTQLMTMGYKFSHLVIFWSVSQSLLYLTPHFCTDPCLCCDAGTFVRT